MKKATSILITFAMLLSLMVFPVSAATVTFESEATTVITATGTPVNDLTQLAAGTAVTVTVTVRRTDVTATSFDCWGLEVDIASTGLAYTANSGVDFLGGTGYRTPWVRDDSTGIGLIRFYYLGSGPSDTITVGNPLTVSAQYTVTNPANAQAWATKPSVYLDSFNSSETVNKCVVTLNDGTTSTTVEADQGESITLPTPTRAGYTFIAWNDGENHPAGSYTVTGTKTLTAVWGATVTFNAAPGSLVEGAASTAAAAVGVDVTLPAATRTGYVLTGWSDGTTTYTETYTVSGGNITLTAVWESASRTITFDGGEGAVVTGGNSRSANVGDVITLPTARRTGYVLSGWRDGSQSYIPGSAYTVGDSTTLTAVWTVCNHDGVKSYGSGTTVYSHISGTHTHNAATTRNVTCAVCGEVLTPETTNETVNCTGTNVTNYLSNATQHWHRCDVCGDFEAADHTFVGNTCSVCGYVRSTGGGGGGSIVNPGGGTTTIVDDEVPLADFDTLVITNIVDPTTGASVTGERDENGHVVVTVKDANGNVLNSVPGGVRVSFTIREGEVAILLDKDGNEIDLLEKSVVEGQTAYVLVDGSCTIDIKYNALPFDDVMPYDWFNSAVVFASSHELFNGVAEGVFAPNMPMTRGMLVTVLWRLENKPEDFGANIFPDVADNTWYTEAVEWATKHKIVEGYDDGTFMPNRNISRQEMAAILYRYMNYLGYDMSAQGDLSTFEDGDSVSAWALPSVRWANGAGIITGKDGNRIDPLGNATRAEVATMFMRIVTEMVM